MSPRAKRFWLDHAIRDLDIMCQYEHGFERWHPSQVAYKRFKFFRFLLDNF